MEKYSGLTHKVYARMACYSEYAFPDHDNDGFGFFVDVTEAVKENRAKYVVGVSAFEHGHGLLAYCGCLDAYL